MGEKLPDDPTPEMLDAGALALADWWVDENHEPSYEAAARLCYAAMVNARGRSNPTGKSPRKSRKSAAPTL